MFKIYSPSYKRSEGVKTHKIIPELIYCVHKFEAEKYKEKGYNIEILPDDLKGNIAKVRNYIKNQLIKGEGVIIDDDIEGLKRWTNISGIPSQVNVEDVELFLSNGFSMAKEIGAKLWGVNILGDKGSFREYTPFSLTSTVSASFMGFINNNVDFDNRLPLKDDYDYCIANLNANRRILRFNSFSLVKKDHENEGGCADYRNMETEMEQLLLLQKKWGSKIVKFDKTKKGSKGKTFDINPIIKVPIKGI